MRISSLLTMAAAISACAAPRWRDDVAHVERLARIDVALAQPSAPDAPLQSLDGLLDESEAVRRATEQHPRIEALLLELGVSRGDAITAGSLPAIEVEGEYLPRPHAEIAIAAEFEVLDAILAPVRGRAELAFHAARVREVAAAVVEIGFQTRRAYHAAQAAALKLAVADRMLAAFEAAESAARALHAAGNLSQLELAGHTLALHEAREAQAAASLEANAARAALASLVGLDANDAGWSVRGALDAPGSDAAIRADLVEASVAASLHLEADRLRIEGLGRDARLARVDARMPDISLGAIGEFHGSDDAAEEQWRFGALAVLEIPLFASGRGAIVSSDAAYEAAQASHRSDAMAVQTAADNVLDALRTTSQAATTCLEQTLPSARELREQTLLHYNAMQIGVFDLLAAYRVELQTESRCIDWLRSYWDARAAQNALLSGALVEAPATVDISGAPGRAEQGGH